MLPQTPTALHSLKNGKASNLANITIQQVGQEVMFVSVSDSWRSSAGLGLYVAARSDLIVSAEPQTSQALGRARCDSPG